MFKSNHSLGQPCNPPHRMATGEEISAAEAPLLDAVVPCTVDFKGRPSLRSKSGCWKSAPFILGAEMAERFCFFGISSNLVTYLTGPLGESTAAAAANWGAWYGTAALSPILGALLADSYLGRFRMIIISSLLYVLGLGLLTLSAALNSSKSSEIQKIFFFISLYLIALAQGGYKPCLQAFGADQFDPESAIESKAKSSFFNWFFWFSCFGTVLALCLLAYIQDNLSWELGFGIPCFVMSSALILFSVGIFTYRFNTTRSEGPVLNRLDVEERKSILRLVPILCTSLGYSVVFVQPTTLFTKQAATMDRRVGPGFQVPAASLQLCIPLSVMAYLAIYDGVFVPVSRSLSKTSTGISNLQRIGIGLAVSLLSIVAAAVVEEKRIAAARECSDPTAVVPMSVWWLAPQYLLSGLSDVFVVVGLQELFYDHVSRRLKSVGIALYISVFGVGSFLSSFLVSVIQGVTSGGGGEGWFSNDLNRAHLDYFYWLLAGLSAALLAAYVYFAKRYVAAEAEHEG